MMITVLDQRQINDQVLLIQFIFQSYDVNSLSLDKYIGADVWSQIFKKLDPILRAYTNESSKEQKITLTRAQLELNVSWTKLRTFHKDLLRLSNGKSCDDLHSRVLVVNVGMVSALDKFKRHFEKKTEKKSTESVDDESNAAATENRSSNGSTSLSPNIEEYVPKPVTDISSSFNYTPSKKSAENAVAISLDDEDVYTPSLTIGDDESQIVTYTPTKLTNPATKTTQMHTDLNRNDCSTEKKSRMEQIFGGDSGDDIDMDGACGLQRSTPKTPQIESNKSKQGVLDHWVNTRPKRTDSKRNGDRADDKRKVRKIGTENNPKRDKNEMTESEKIRKLRKDFEAMESKEATIDRIIDLKNMEIDDIIETFPKHEAVLREMFQNSKKTPDNRFVPALSENQFLGILDELLLQTQQIKMVLKIHEEFERKTAKEITSNHENLFWKGMLPEWALQIFMDKFSLSRDDAMKQLTDQARVKDAQKYPLDLDF